MSFYKDFFLIKATYKENGKSLYFGKDKHIFTDFGWWEIKEYGYATRGGAKMGEKSVAKFCPEYTIETIKNTVVFPDRETYERKK